MTKKIKVPSSPSSADSSFNFEAISTKLLDEPILKIGGENIELVQLSKTELESFIKDNYIFQTLEPIANIGLKWDGKYPNHDILNPKDIKIWKASVEKNDFYLTEGSEVNVDKITGDASAEPRLTILIGSSIKAKAFAALGKNTLLNSTIDVENYFSTKDSEYKHSHLHGSNIFNIGSNTIIGSYIVVSGYIQITKTYIASTHISGIKEFSSDQTRIGNVEIAIHNNASVSLRVANQSLIDFNYRTFLSDNCNKYAVTKNKYSADFLLSVSNRIDYGYFSGLAKSHPFIKLDDINIIVGGYVFTADEFKNPSFDHSKYPHSGYLTPTSLSPICPPSNMEYMKGTDTWAKAEKLISGNHADGSKILMGELATKSASVLLEQIKSRISLLVEIKNILG